MPFPTLGDLADPRIEPASLVSPTLAGRFFTTEPPGKSWDQSISAAAAAAKSLQLCPTLCDPIDGSPPGFPSLGFSRQEHWSGLPLPSPMLGK